MRNYISLKRKYIIPSIIEISIKYNLKLFLFLIIFNLIQNRSTNISSIHFIKIFPEKEISKYF